MMNEAENLKRLMEGRNRAEFARDYKIPGGQSMIYQHITGRKPISLECAVAYAIGLGRPLVDISPRLAALVDKIPTITTDSAHHVSEPPGRDYHIAALLAAVERLTPEDARALLPVVTRIADSQPRSTARRRGTKIDMSPADTAAPAPATDNR